MPHRFIAAAILVFWLAMTGWLIEREVVPMMLAEASPSYQPDLTEEVGSPVIAWTVLRDNQRIGSVRSRMRTRDDRSRDFHANYQFSKFGIGPVQVEKIDLSYRVSEEGKLIRLSTRFELIDPNHIIELKGDIVNEEIEPILTFNDLKLPDIGKIKFVQKGHFINPMHLLPRLKGLHEGRTWTIALPDLKSSTNNHLVGELLKQAGGPSVLIAEVKSDTLDWNGKQVDCHKIEYHEPGKEVTVRTWVRKADGLVLQQDMSQFGFDMAVVRMP